ncbi:glycosyltransferase family 2 protein [Agromyces albus]|uniref:glycosyltransferase family 2 protein n=1 Tax=Agromyces albus TaxID=205332 RepID=UPI0027892D51|nr:glycosyltransferase [Agromyces albus]MDQ0577134.1 glycosyltransferase involved in cell wall biosynthesis [Agromyces albus]
MTREIDTGVGGRPDPRPPIVTIVIPLYNGGRFIDETLRSVLTQTYSQFEVVVVDDGSTDDGPGIVRTHLSDPRVQLVQNPLLGVAEARNMGAARASGHSMYLVFLDADDLWDPEALGALVDAVNRRPDAAGAFVLAEYIDGDGNVLYPGDFPRHMRGREDLRGERLVPRDSTADVQFEHLFLSNLVYPPSCLLVRRTAFEAAGGFDGRYLAEDWEFVVRLAKQGPFVPVDRVLVGYRRHALNTSGNRARNVRGARQIWAAVYHGDFESDGTRKLIRGIWRAHQARTARRKLAEARALIVRGKLLCGMSRAADGIAHALLRQPPRIWMAQGAKVREHEVRSTVLSRFAG